MVLAKKPEQDKGCVISVQYQGPVGELGTLSAFREAFYGSLRRRSDALFELCDAVFVC
jgi:hypothetical protein